MTDLIAGLAALGLVFVALRLAAALHRHRRERAEAEAAERARGRVIVAELPSLTAPRFFSHDAARFYLGDRVVDKDRIRAVHLLVNGRPMASAASPQFPGAGGPPLESLIQKPRETPGDRWDVAITTSEQTILVACGAIRDGVSQELARKVYDAVKGAIDHPRREPGASNGGPAESTEPTTPPPPSPPGGSPRAPRRRADPTGG